jgi:hypothetical protein
MFKRELKLALSRSATRGWAVPFVLQFFVHCSGYESLYEHVPREALPKEYGGKLDSIQDLTGESGHSEPQSPRSPPNGRFQLVPVLQTGGTRSSCRCGPGSCGSSWSAGLTRHAGRQDCPAPPPLLWRRTLRCTEPSDSWASTEIHLEFILNTFIFSRPCGFSKRRFSGGRPINMLEIFLCVRMLLAPPIPSFIWSP